MAMASTNPLPQISGFLLVIVLLGIVCGCTAKPNVVLALPRTELAAQSFAAVTLTNTQHGSNLELVLIEMGTSALANAAAIHGYVTANGSVTSLAVVLPPFPAIDSITEVFNQQGIEVLRLDYEGSVEDLEETPALRPSFIQAAYFKATAALMRQLAWNETLVIRSSAFQSEANTFESTAEQFGISVSAQLWADANFPTSLAEVITFLGNSPIRIAVVLGSAEDLTSLALRLIDASIELIWIDSSAKRPSYTSVQLDSLRSVTGNSVIRGFLAVAPPHDLSHTGPLLSSLQASYPQLFSTSDGLSLYQQTSQAIIEEVTDLVGLWATTLAQISTEGGDVNNKTLARQAFRSLLAAQSEGALIAGPYSFDPATGHRTGALQILNFQLESLSNSTSFIPVGWWSTLDLADTGTVGDLTWTVPASQLVFSSGSHQLPTSRTSAVVSFGLIWTDFFSAYWGDVCQLAAEAINSNPSILPGYTLRLIYENDFNSQAGAIQAAIRLADRGVSAIIGPPLTRFAQATQYYVGALNLPAISMSATSDTLSDSQAYPTFFRTILADKYQGAALANVVHHYNWSNVCITHYDDPYATSMADYFVNAAGPLGINPTLITPYFVSETNYTATLDQIEQVGCPTIIAIVDIPQVVNLLPQAYERKLFAQPNITWLFTDAFVLYYTLAGGLDPSLYQGVFATIPADSPQGNPQYDSLIQRYQARTNNTELPIFAAFAYDAVTLAARTLGQVIRATNNPRPTDKSYVEAIRRSSLDGVTGPISFIPNTGDRKDGFYYVYNWQTRGNTTDRVLIAEVSTSAKIKTLGEAIFADGTTRVPVDPPFPTKTVTFEQGAPLIAVLGLLLFVLFATLIVIIRHWRNSLIRRSSPFFLVCILIGLAGALVSIFFWLGAPSQAHCHLRYWLGFVGVALAYGSLLAKNARLAYLFNEPSLRVIAITNTQLMSYLIIFLSPLIIVLILWSSIAPQDVAMQLTASGREQYIICKSLHDLIFLPIAFAYMGGGLLAGAILSYKTRHLPDTFRESWFIALATYNLLVISVICIVLGYILSYDTVASTVIVCVGLIIGVGFTWALIFGPKMHALFFRQEEIDELSPSRRSNRKTSAPTSNKRSLSVIDHSMLNGGASLARRSLD